MKKKIALAMVFAVLLSLNTSCVKAEDNFLSSPKHVNYSNQGFKEQHKEKFKQKKEEIRKRLNLTDEQKEKAKELRMEIRPKIKPVVEQIQSERGKIMQMKQSGASEDQIKAEREKIKGLRDEAHKIRQEHINKFESILDPQQKNEFEKIRAEKKQRMEEFRNNRHSGNMSR